MRQEQIGERGAACQAVQPGDIVERIRVFGQLVRLAIVDHLEPVLDRAQRDIGPSEILRLVEPDPPRLGQRGERVARGGRAQRRLAAAMDELVDLGEELDLADAAPPPFQVIAGAERLGLRIMIADAAADVADLADRAIVERAAPHERTDRVEETAAERQIAGTGPGADEGGAFPGQRLALIIGDRRLDRQHDRRHFWRGAQAQVDAQHIAVAVARLEQLDHAAADPHRRFLHVLARAAGQRLGIEKQDRIDVRRIVQLAAALLAERDRGESARLGVGRALEDRRADRPVQRFVGEIGEEMGDAREVEPAREIAQGDEEREPAALDAQPRALAHFAHAGPCGRAGVRKGGVEIGDQHSLAREQVVEEGRMGPNTCDGVGEICGEKDFSHGISHLRNGALQKVKQQNEN